MPPSPPAVPSRLALPPSRGGAVPPLPLPADAFSAAFSSRASCAVAKACSSSRCFASRCSDNVGPRTRARAAATVEFIRIVAASYSMSHALSTESRVCKYPFFRGAQARRHRIVLSRPSHGMHTTRRDKLISRNWLPFFPHFSLLPSLLPRHMCPVPPSTKLHIGAKRRLLLQTL